MTCTDERTMQRGTLEYLTGTVTADAEIGTDTIEVSFDRVTWYPAAWTGAAGLTQTWRMLVGGAVPLPDGGLSKVWVRITDSPEIPWLDAGTLRIV